MANYQTFLDDLINPEVMADMISAKIPDKITITPFAKVDTTLQGRAGDTITVPKYVYVGPAETIAEGAACPTNKLETTSAQYTIQKAMKAISITDEAVLSGYGNPVGQANTQLAKAVADKIDADAITALLGATTVYDGTADVISYEGIVNAVDLFQEEIQQDKVMFVAPSQVTALRLDPDFISADKYGQGTLVMMKGEIGNIAGVRVVPTRRIVASEAQEEVKGVYTLTLSGTATIDDSIKVNGETVYTAEDADAAATIASAIATALASDDTFTVAASSAAVTFTQKVGGTGDKPVITFSVGATVSGEIAVTTVGVPAIAAGYVNPIVQLTAEPETEDETAALTLYMKRGVNVETERHTLTRTTDISIDEIYAVCLTDVSKVVLATFAVTAG